MSHTETLLRLMTAMPFAERRALQRAASEAGARIEVSVGSTSDRFWARAGELGWAERGRVEEHPCQRRRRYRVTRLGAKALPVLLLRWAGVQNTTVFGASPDAPLAGRAGA